MHWIALTGFGSFVYFTCSRSTRGTSLVQCITFGNRTLCTASFSRCKSCSIQHYRRIETHRLVEPSCWKRTGNLFDHKITADEKKEKKHTTYACKRKHNRRSMRIDYFQMVTNFMLFPLAFLPLVRVALRYQTNATSNHINWTGFFLVSMKSYAWSNFCHFSCWFAKISVNLNKFTEYQAKYHIALGYLSHLELKCDIFIHFDCEKFENIRCMSPVK